MMRDGARQVTPVALPRANEGRALVVRGEAGTPLLSR